MGGGLGEVTASEGAGFSFWCDENTLKLGCNNGCTSI